MAARLIGNLMLRLSSSTDGRLAIAALCVGAGAVYLAIFAVPPAIPVLVGEFSLRYSQAGLLMTVPTLVYAVSSLVAGDLANRFGSLAVIAVGVAICGAATVASSLTTTFYSLLVCRAAIGLAAGLVYAPSVSVIASGEMRRKSSFGVGSFLASIYLGISGANLLTSTLVNDVGWHWTFRVYGLVCLLAALPTAMIALAGSGARNQGRVGQPAARDESEIRKRSQRMPLFRNESLWAISTGLFLGAFVLYGALTWIPPFLQSIRGISLTAASVVASTASFVAIPTCVLAGWATDRWQRPVLIMRCGLGCASLIVLTPLIVRNGLQPLAMTLLVIAVGGVAGSLVPLFAISGLNLDPALSLRATAIATSASLCGGIFSTYGGGYLVDRTANYTLTFSILSVVSLACATVVGTWIDSSLYRTVHHTRMFEGKVKGDL